MTFQSNSLPHDIYLLKTGLNREQLTSSISRCLCQAEALAIVATFIDTEAVGLDTINHYFWTLSGLIQETRWLYEHLITKY